MRTSRAPLIILVAFFVAGLLGAVAVSSDSPPGDPAEAASAFEVTTTAGATTTTIDPEVVESFATAYDAHLVDTWVTTTNRNIWILKTTYEQDQERERQRLAAEQLARSERAAAAKAEAAIADAPAPSSPSVPAVEQGSGRCGGDLPPCYVMMRESGGNIRARNPSSSASGKWQFIRGTWAGYGGYSEAHLAPESVQDAKARELWAGGAGCGHWNAC